MRLGMEHAYIAASLHMGSVSPNSFSIHDGDVDNGMDGIVDVIH
jgi:hypothetical protein